MVPVATTSSPVSITVHYHKPRTACGTATSIAFHASEPSSSRHSIHTPHICILHAPRAKRHRSADWACSRPPRTSSRIADGLGRVQTPPAGRTTAMHETMSGSRVLERSPDTGRQPDGGTGTLQAAETQARPGSMGVWCPILVTPTASRHPHSKHSVHTDSGAWRAPG